MHCLYLLDTLFPSYIVLFLFFIISHKRYPLPSMSACDTYFSFLECEAFSTWTTTTSNFSFYPTHPSTQSSGSSKVMVLTSSVKVVSPHFYFLTLPFNSQQAGFCPDHSKKYLTILDGDIVAQLRDHFLDSYWPPRWHLTLLIISSVANYSAGTQLTYQFLQDDFLDSSESGKALPNFLIYVKAHNRYLYSSSFFWFQVTNLF